MIRKMMRRWFFSHCAKRTAYNAALDARAELLKVLGLPADATDEQITAELKKLNDEADTAAADKAAMEAEKVKATAANAALLLANANLATATDAKKTAEEAHTKVLAVAVNSILEHGMTTGRITGAERAEWEGKLKTDFVANTEALSKRTPAFNTRPLDLHAGGALAVPTDVAARGVAYNSAIAAKRTELNCDDAAAEDALKTCPKYGALWKAVNAPAA